MQISRPISNQPIPTHAKRVFRGVLFDVYQWEQRLYDGKTTMFEKLKRPDTVLVFPVLDDGRILVAEQTEPGREPFIGALGGRINENEDVAVAAERELFEESGYRASQFILWDAQHPTTKIDWVIYTLVAKGLQRVSAGATDAGEKIELKPVSLDELIELATGGLLSDKEIALKFFEAKVFPEKKHELQNLFQPTR